ncbi:MAG: hypothetical protein ACRD4Y_07385, partial [Candidatus Acidiferrales bacterium]
VRFVYDVAGAEAEDDHATDPSIPVMKRHSDTTNSSSNAPGSQSGQASGASSDTQKSSSDESPLSPPLTQPDPNQPVMRRHADDGGGSSQ